MARKILPLSDAQIKNEKPQEKQFTKFDGDGLFLKITPTGGKLWRFKYRLNGKEKVMAMGSYPEVSLATARKKREEAREQVAAGIDPADIKKALKKATAGSAANSFEVITREWHADQVAAKSWSVNHAEQKLQKLQNELFAWIGSKPIDAITTPELLENLRRVAARGALDGAHRLRFDCEKIFAHAIASGRAKSNPALELKGILPAVKNENFPAFTKPKDVSRLMKAIDAYNGGYLVKAALQLSPLLFTRPGELRHMEWTELDFETALWEIPAEKMKMKNPHIVPLCKQAIAVLLNIQPLTGNGKYVFPSARGGSRCMSENAINVALRTMGISGDEHVAHGFRATARTVAREQLKIDTEYLEIQLAHSTKAPNGTAYDRVAFLPERIEMMQQWADYLDRLRTS